MKLDAVPAVPFLLKAFPSCTTCIYALVCGRRLWLLRVVAVAFVVAAVD